MTGGIISSVMGAVLGIVSGAIAGANASKAKKRAISNLTKNETWFNNERYKNILNSDSNREIMNTLSKNINLNNVANNMQADIMGINSNQLQKREEQANKDYSDSISNIKVEGEKEKEKSLERFLNANNNAAQQLAKSEEDTANAIGTAISGTLAAAGDIADASLTD